MRPATKQKRKLKYKPQPHPLQGKVVKYYSNGWHAGILLHAIHGGDVVIEHVTKGKLTVPASDIRSLEVDKTIQHG